MFMEYISNLKCVISLGAVNLENVVVNVAGKNQKFTYLKVYEIKIYTNPQNTDRRVQYKYE